MKKKLLKSLSLVTSFLFCFSVITSDANLIAPIVGEGNIIENDFGIEEFTGKEPSDIVPLDDEEPIDVPKY